MLLPRTALMLACALLAQSSTVAHADEPYTDDRKVSFYKDGATFGDLTYGQLLTCIETASFENEPGPRDIERKIKRLIVTNIHGDRWFFKIREEINYVILVDITINTRRYSSEVDMSKHLLHILAHCNLPVAD